MKKLTKNKIKFIVANFYEKNGIDFRKFEKLKSPEELHFLAKIYNWDFDLTVLRKIIQSPHCDKGTALMLFWRACPEDLLEFSNEKEADNIGDDFLLVKEITKKYINNQFKTSIIEYDHQKDNFGDVLTRKNKNIDEIFYHKLKGEEFPEYEWPLEEAFQKTLVTQEEANGVVKINTTIRSIFIDEKANYEEIEKVTCLNSQEIEKEILFPKELWDKKFQYTKHTNSWTTNFVLLTNEECDVTHVIFTFADNKLILDCGNNISKLKFKLTEDIPKLTAVEIYVEVIYSVNRFIEKTKKTLNGIK